MNKRIWLVSRHPGAQTWLKQQGFQGQQIAHLDIDTIAAGDIIIGSLPIHMVVALTLKSAEYWHLSMTIPECWRGTELTPEQMQLCQIKLQKITAQAEDFF
ncbi:CRISPR-associated protein Csx16 [Shewanella putrefaciens]|uniref:CRISPR-associated protein Csx16 n=1 Tax=unclassified Shewanella TaxID=196818 RepID=UPI0020063ECE|nr:MULTISPECIES: CRISPR-associated protein Csx16 [unclassified Shewanella]MCK7629342.1 CRISPR-associated protein Csx16 [Shewanella sp. JNE9-1]MCK7652512.1 CRISPR-associated protein Csx16 [Shewanella sp. JNE4-1]